MDFEKLEEASFKHICSYEGCSQRFRDNRSLEGHMKKCQTRLPEFRQMTRSRTAIKRMDEESRKQYDAQRLQYARSHCPKRPPQRKEDRVRCNLCDHECARSSLQDHKKKRHGGSDGGAFLFKCRHCDHICASKQGRDAHEACIHKIGNQRPCPYCSMVFGDGSNFLKHVRRHSKPYKCDKCKATFSEEADLILHQKNVHSKAGRIRRKVSEDQCYDALLQAKFQLQREARINFQCALSHISQQFACIDFIIPRQQALFLVENDEDQHKAYPLSCELKRMMDAYSSLMASDTAPKVPVVFIRFNPHSFMVNDDPQQVAIETRFQALIETVQTYQPTLPFTVLYLYYDSITDDATGNLKLAIIDDPDCDVQIKSFLFLHQ